MPPAFIAVVFAAVSTVADAQTLPAQVAPARQTPPAQGRPAPASPAPATPAPPPADPVSPYDRDALTPEYRIAPGDVLQIFVWKEPELSREVRVRPDGYLTVRRRKVRFQGIGK